MHTEPKSKLGEHHPPKLRRGAAEHGSANAELFDPDYRIVSSTLKFRLIIFVAAIATAVTLLVWNALAVWQRIDTLRERLTSIYLESFHIADRFQQSIQELDNTLVRYAINRNEADWTRFLTTSHELDHWIDQQRPHLNSSNEVAKLNVIDSAYDDYRAAAAGIAEHVRVPGRETSLHDFAPVTMQSERLVNLGFQLADEHRRSLDEFLRSSSDSLVQIRRLLLASLFSLLLLVSGLAVMIYRGMIAPLQVKLIESQALLERNEKLASLGMLAAGVAHEIRNPLTAIKARLFTLQKRLASGSANQVDSEVISQEINRLERIVKDVLQFARPSEPELAITPADEPLRKIHSLLSGQLEQQQIQLRVNGATNAAIRVDGAQMQQVLINLVQNAAEAIGNNGTVTLSARTDVKRLGGAKQEVVILEVADNGNGIAPEVEKRLFDPFFSTKEAGTGLGLAIASRIVEKHGGALQYRTEVNHGTTFGVVLPRA